MQRRDLGFLYRSQTHCAIAAILLWPARPQCDPICMHDALGNSIAHHLVSKTNLNPGYRVYSIDTDTYQVVDSDTYITDLSLSAKLDQQNRKPTYYKEYSARAYLPRWPKTAPLNAKFWSQVTARMESNTATWKLYMKVSCACPAFTLCSFCRFKYRGKSAGLDSLDCINDAACKAAVICDASCLFVLSVVADRTSSDSKRQLCISMHQA